MVKNAGGNKTKRGARKHTFAPINTNTRLIEEEGGLSKAIKESKSMWEEIKAGKHATYEQGKATRKASKKSKKSKTEKKGKKSVSAVAGSVDTNKMLKDCKVCKKCLKKVEKYLKKHGSSDE